MRRDPLNSPHPLQLPARSHHAAGPADSELPPGIVVWQYCVADADEHTIQAACAQLDVAERARMAAFVRHADRRRFALAHAILRMLLASRLACHPSELSFVVGAFGKPALAHHAYHMHHTAPYFNVSHAGDYVLIALSEHCDIGVDIEYRDPHLDVGSLIEFVWSEQERRDEQVRPCDFFARWSGKEAVLKALGVGVGQHLQSLSVQPNRDGSFALAHEQPQWAGVSACQLVSPPGYAAAVAWLSNH